VALKILPPELTERPDRISRFLQEAQAASALNHAYILHWHAHYRETIGRLAEGQAEMV